MYCLCCNNATMHVVVGFCYGNRIHQHCPRPKCNFCSVIMKSYKTRLFTNIFGKSLLSESLHILRPNVVLHDFSLSLFVSLFHSHSLPKQQPTDARNIVTICSFIKHSSAMLSLSKQHKNNDYNNHNNINNKQQTPMTRAGEQVLPCYEQIVDQLLQKQSNDIKLLAFAVIVVAVVFSSSTCICALLRIPLMHCHARNPPRIIAQSSPTPEIIEP